ncbi:hypothetical protein ACSBL2_20595 [Pedobacter sp. AW31-3R]|uniref:hypothetical protein n=1 Tax=Pedobacter sp. AW31-3R TaxID=3445781 RepID=UPI003F9FD52B
MDKYKNAEMELAATIIKEKMNAESVFCFGEATNHKTSCSFFSSQQRRYFSSMHYDFLVVTSAKTELKPGKRIKIKELMVQEEVACTLVVHTLEEVEQGLKDNNRFFHTVINTVEHVPGHDKLLAGLFTIPFDKEADQEDVLQRSQAFYADIEAYEQLRYSSQKPHICVPLISRQLEKVCLWLIYVMMGYEPQGYTLKGLVNLCTGIDRRFEKVIPRITEADCYHYKVLMQGVWKGKYGRDREPIMEYLHKAVDDFSSLAEEICGARLMVVSNPVKKTMHKN